LPTGAACQAWPSEIGRVLKPGGIFPCTVHVSKRIRSLVPNEIRDFRAGIPVYRSKAKVGRRYYMAYHPERYSRNNPFMGFVNPAGPIQALGRELRIPKKPFTFNQPN